MSGLWRPPISLNSGSFWVRCARIFLVTGFSFSCISLGCKGPFLLVARINGQVEACMLFKAGTLSNLLSSTGIISKNPISCYLYIFLSFSILKRAKKGKKDKLHVYTKFILYTKLYRVSSAGYFQLKFSLGRNKESMQIR